MVPFDETRYSYKIDSSCYLPSTDKYDLRCHYSINVVFLVLRREGISNGPYRSFTLKFSYLQGTWTETFTLRHVLLGHLSSFQEWVTYWFWYAVRHNNAREWGDYQWRLKIQRNYRIWKFMYFNFFSLIII